MVKGHGTSFQTIEPMPLFRFPVELVGDQLLPRSSCISDGPHALADDLDSVNFEPHTFFIHKTNPGLTVQK